MFSKFDKAYTAVLVAFLASTASTFFGIEISPENQAGLVAVITGLFVWLVPNKA